MNKYRTLTIGHNYLILLKKELETVAIKRTSEAPSSSVNQMAHKLPDGTKSNISTTKS